MAMLLDNSRLDGLGRLCERGEDSGIYAAPPTPGISRIGARFYGRAYAPHRHDTYSLGITIRGVQTFTYRGKSRVSLPGNLVILHPDELHDGGAGTEDGLVYRMLYLEPSLLQKALGEKASGLPFVSDPVISDRQLATALLSALADLSADLDELAADDFVAAAADGLSRHAGASIKRKGHLHLPGLEQARSFLDQNIARSVDSSALEEVSGLDRFTLSRQFRTYCGTSPHRYLVMRRLDRARMLIADGMPLAEIAVVTGFSDQSHFNRHFKKAFGMSPGVWSALLRTKNREHCRF